MRVSVSWAIRDLICFAIVLLAVVVWLYLLINGTPGFFQRFGSAMIALAIIAFLVDRASYGKTDLGIEDAFGVPLFLEVKFSMKLSLPSVVLVELVLIFTGTLTWGYGDLLHCWINGESWALC